MKLNVYSVFDAKSQVFNNPFYSPTNGAAIRSFIELANSKDTLIGKFPDDFSLMHIGVYDDATGVFENVVHSNLGTGRSYIQSSVLEVK